MAAGAWLAAHFLARDDADQAGVLGDAAHIAILAVTVAAIAGVLGFKLGRDLPPPQPIVIRMEAPS